MTTPTASRRPLARSLRSLQTVFARQSRASAALHRKFRNDPAALIEEPDPERASVAYQPSSELLALILCARSYAEQLEELSRRVAKGTRARAARERRRSSTR